MTTERDPVRWSEQPEGATPALGRALAAYANQGPQPEQVTRMSDRLLADIARGVLPRGERPAHSNLTWWLGSAGLLGLVLAGIVVLRPDGVAKKRTAVPVPERVAASETQGLAPSAEEVLPEPAGSPAKLPKKQTTPTAKRAVGERVTLPATPADPQAELALLRPARQLLAVKPARSLELAGEHEQRFPQGLFSEERAVIRIEALARLGQRPAAEQAARAFRKLHPTSTYLARVNEIVAQP